MAEKANKSQSVRDYLHKNKKATNQQVVDALGEQGIDLTTKQVSAIKYQAKNSTKKKSTKKKTTPKKTAKGRKKRSTSEVKSESAQKRKYLQRSYPQRTLEEALVIPQKIKEENAGNPWATDDIADACGVSRKTNNFFYLASAARDYGLTVGTRDTQTIELTDVGRDIVYAGDSEVERQNKINAFFSIDIFKRVYDYYGGSDSLPSEKQYLSNTLQREFSIGPDLHDEFVNTFRSNCEFLGIQSGLGKAKGEVEKSEVGAEHHAGEIRIVGEAPGKFDRTAFVVMPFSEKGETPRAKGFFMQVLKNLITPAGNKAGFAVETAEREGTEVIQSTILRRLMHADLVITDLTDHNPNVLFELGIRIATEKPVQLIRAEGTKPIFDVDHMLRVCSYDPNLWIDTLAEDVKKLTKHIKASWDNRGQERSYMQILTGEPLAKALTRA